MSDETTTTTSKRPTRATPAVRVTGETPAVTGPVAAADAVPVTTEEQILAEVIKELLRLATDLGFEPAQRGVNPGNLDSLEISHMRIDAAARVQTQAGRLTRLLRQRHSLVVDQG